MRSALSLHVGVNRTDRHHYGSTRYRPLRCCDSDAYAMRDIAEKNGCSVLGTLINECATFDAVEQGFRTAARELADGGTFIFTFSGHGAQLLRADYTADGGYDEGLVLSDGIMKDDYIATLLRLFSENTLVIFVCDACHSATMFGFSGSRPRHKRTVLPEAQEESTDEPRYKLMDTTLVDNHRRNLYALYQERDQRFAAERGEYLAAQVAVLSACNDNEVAVESEQYGLFTSALLSVLENTNEHVSLSYKTLIEAVRKIVGNVQTPSFTPLNIDPLSPLLRKPPFTLFEEIS